MKLASEFSVPAAPDTVFPLFFDPETMRGCIPGCEVLERVDEKTYRGRLVNEIAHVRFSAGFSADITSVTDNEVVAVLKGEDRRLGSTIKIDARLSVRPDGDASVIGYEMDMALWGKLGRLGEPIIRRRSREVELEFARSLAIACGAPADKLPQKAEKSRPVRKLAADLAGRTRAAGFASAAGSVPAAGFASAAGSAPAAGFASAAGSVPAAGFADAAGSVPAAGFADAGDPAAAAPATLSGMPSAAGANGVASSGDSRGIAVAALIVSLVALVVAVFGRGR